VFFFKENEEKDLLLQYNIKESGLKYGDDK